LRPLRGRALQLLLIDVEQRHAPVARIEPLRDRQPDAAGGTGDQGNARSSRHVMRLLACTCTRACYRRTAALSSIA
jgi:hypothetical protein